MTRHVLRFHLGPVHEFISAGRRTRDLWAGSFLLSRLVGEAMLHVRREGGEITLPFVGEDGELLEPTLRAIEAAEATHYALDRHVPGPLVGTLVNHFRAEVDEGYDPRQAIELVKARYRSIAAAVFAVFIRPAIGLLENHGDARLRLEPHMAAAIGDRWQRQTTGDFFEFLWVKGEPEDWASESRWLDRRKTWRRHLDLADEAEGGDRCPVHPQYLELGGFDRSRPDMRLRQDAFWEAVRYVVARRMYESDGNAHDGEAWEARPRVWPLEEGRSQFDETLELRPSERLSAPALVKRLFPLLSARRLAATLGWLPAPTSVNDVKGRIDVEAVRHSMRNWPSTAFVAALPWIIELGNALRDEAEKYARDQLAALGYSRLLLSERPQYHKVKAINDLLEPDRRAGRAINAPFLTMDGTLHYERGLERRRLTSAEHGERADAIAGDLARNLRRLRSRVEAYNTAHSADLDFVPIDPAGPSRFYAFLEMDGDRMGEVFSYNKDLAIEASKALGAFAEAARRTVDNHDGITVYAGADDVLAFVPLNRAIACAIAIEQCWTGYFSTPNLRAAHTSISGSIVCADYQVPLNHVRETTHRCLDDVAKDGNGRHSLSVAVIKSGGINSSWVDVFGMKNEGSPPAGDELGRTPPRMLVELVREQLRLKIQPSGLIHKMRIALDELLRARDAVGADLVTDEELVLLVKKELADSAIAGRYPETDRLEWSHRLVALMRGHRRRLVLRAGKVVPSVEPRGRTLDGPFVAQELATQTLGAYEHRSGALTSFRGTT